MNLYEIKIWLSKLILIAFQLLGDYKISGRDSLVFLVDASKEMFIKGEDGEASNFAMTMQVSQTLPFY